MPEILAPVGGEEQFIAALRSGADAVYLGTHNFNARRNAQNFDAGSLPDIVSRAHLRNVKVYVTFNTLVSDDELPAVLDEIKYIALSGADAVIVQDLAVAKLFREHCPSMPLHASTQMSITNAAGIAAVRKLGFTRAVLARELSLEEIKTIRASTPEDFSLEVFVHGALCVSLSGGCYLSSMLGGRSGNRGLCAGPCRLDFKCGGRDFALSLKDMSYISHMTELREAGVESFKIEGRMKRPEYVAAAVTACRDAIEGRKPDTELLRSLFSRSGFTDGYLTGKRDITMFGARTKDDSTDSTSLSKASELFRRERSSVRVDMKLSLGSVSSLSISDGCETVHVTGSAPLFPEASPTDRKSAAKYLGRTGGTPFFLGELTVENPSSLYIPASALNELRRRAIDELTALRSSIKPHEYLDFFSALPPKSIHSPGRLRIRLGDASLPPLLDSLDDCDEIVLPSRLIDRETVSQYGERLIAELPFVVYGDYLPSLLREGERLRSLGVTDILCENIGTLHALKDYGFKLHGGSGLNIYNSLSLAEYESLGLCDTVVSFELSMSKISALRGELPRGIIGYGKLPLMRFRSCPNRGEKGCRSCPGKAVICDRYGVEFPLICEERQYSTLLNSLPLYVADKNPTGFDFTLLYFTDEDSTLTDRVIKKYRAAMPPRFDRTNGLYFRTTK